MVTVVIGTRRVALESKKVQVTYESLVLSLLLYGPECWVVTADSENMRLLQRFHWHRRCIRIMCATHSELEA
jgi:hypothetical protein